MVMKKQRRTTLEDVARAAGVSMMTVSRVINNKGRISQETRNRVFEIIENLDYRPNHAARTLVTNKTFMVALVEPDITNPYFSEVFQGVEDVLRLENYNVLVANTDETPAREKEILEKLGMRRLMAHHLQPSPPDAELLPFWSVSPVSWPLHGQLLKRLAALSAAIMRPVTVR
jgi:LacI family transcriptional regulator